MDRVEADEVHCRGVGVLACEVLGRLGFESPTKQLTVSTCVPAAIQSSTARVFRK